MNKIRNKVAAAGGNAMVIVSTKTDIFATTVVVEGLTCDLGALQPSAERSYEKIPLHLISIGYSKKDVEQALGAPVNVIGSKQFPEGVVEVWSYQRWQRTGPRETLEEEYWIYFWNGKVSQWGRPGDWQQEADRIYELRIR